MGANLAKGGNAFLDALPGTQVSIKCYFKLISCNVLLIPNLRASHNFIIVCRSILEFLSQQELSPCAMSVII